MSSEKRTFKDILFKDAIVTGIISSLIFTFVLQPFIPIIWSFFKNSGLQIYTNFSNQIYSAAAIGYRNDVERIISALLSSVLIFFTFSTVTFFFFDIKGYNSIGDFINNKKITSLTKTKAAITTTRILEIGLIIFFVVFSIQTILNTTLIYAATEFNASFNQRLNAVRPYLSEQDEEEIVSSWALMENENDYNKINGNLEKVASENKIVLPKTLWPDVLNSVYIWP